MTEDSESRADEAADEHELRIAAAIAKFSDQRAREEPIDVKEFCSQFPDLFPELNLQLEALDSIDQLLEPGETPAIVTPTMIGTEPLPDTLSGYRVVSELGSGGMGRVLLAMDDQLGRKLAIKTLSPRFKDNSQIRTRFAQEARAMARLNHPHIVRIYNLGPADQEPHFVMEYVEGAPLTEAAKALPIRSRVELLIKVVEAVDFLHQNQIIHRDLKPANILVGPNLEPKVLDFGLALPVNNRGRRVTLEGEVVGTPDYFSPEQAQGQLHLDIRSDLFSLGTILYELLSGQLPFSGRNIREQIQKICGEDPDLPRRINPAVPGDLQKICLKALEKDPADRYASAAEMAADLERWLVGEPVLASPSTYARIVSDKVEQHLADLKAWKQDHILSDYEFDGFRKLYGRLFEQEDSWLLEMRRFSMSQVSLYLGAWITVVGASLVLLFYYPSLSGTRSVALVAAITAAAGIMGVRCWKRGQLRIAVAYLLAFCLLLPLALLDAMNEWGLLATLTRDDPDLELFSLFAAFKMTTNRQIWWGLLLSLPAYWWLRRFTRSSVFTLVFAVMLAQLCVVALLRLGLIRWLEEDPGRPYFYLLPAALLFFLCGITLEKLGYPSDSRYFHPIAVAFTLVALSGVALFHEPYAQWLDRAFPFTRGQIEYLFLINASIYLVIQHLCETFRSPQMRSVAKSFRFVVPTHILGSILLLEMSAYDRWQEAIEDVSLRWEARFFEILLPAVACLFVFGSISKQMKNFLATGLVFLAVGLIRLQQDLFQDVVWWPLALLGGGVILMGVATNYARIKVAFFRMLRRARRQP